MYDLPPYPLKVHTEALYFLEVLFFLILYSRNENEQDFFDTQYALPLPHTRAGETGVASSFR